jgi:hypothetical protein
LRFGLTRVLSGRSKPVRKKFLLAAGAAVVLAATLAAWVLYQRYANGGDVGSCRRSVERSVADRSFRDAAEVEVTRRGNLMLRDRVHRIPLTGLLVPHDELAAFEWQYERTEAAPDRVEREVRAGRGVRGVVPGPGGDYVVKRE